MQSERSAEPSALSGSVRGLGVCDVLRVELQPVQRAGLEQALAAHAAELERRKAALGLAVRQHAAASAERERLGEVAETLRLLARVRVGLPSRNSSPLVVTGPADLVLDVVDVCLADAVSRAAERLEAAQGGPPRGSALVGELEAAAAWIATALDCAAVDGFCFEPGVDPVRSIR